MVLFSWSIGSDNWTNDPVFLLVQFPVQLQKHWLWHRACCFFLFHTSSMFSMNLPCASSSTWDSTYQKPTFIEDGWTRGFSSSTRQQDIRCRVSFSISFLAPLAPHDTTFSTPRWHDTVSFSQGDRYPGSEQEFKPWFFV